MAKTITTTAAALMILTGTARAQPTRPAQTPDFQCFSATGGPCGAPATVRPSIPGLTYDANGYPIIHEPAPWQLYIACMRHMQEEGGLRELTDPAAQKSAFDHAAAFCSVSSFGH